MKATIDRFGRIVIPKKLRDDFNLEPGSQIHIEESGQEIILRPIHEGAFPWLKQAREKQFGRRLQEPDMM